MNTTSDFQTDLIKTYGANAGPSLFKVISGHFRQDKTFGIKFNPTTRSLTIGNTKAELDGKSVVLHLADGQQARFKATPGLIKLLTMEVPDNYESSDLDMYKKILELTSAHKHHCDPRAHLKSSVSTKYKTIIAPLFGKKKVGGGGGVGNMILNNNPIDYVWFDDANEIVERLKLLIASQQAGNNAHQNEINSIISELIEMGIVIS